MTRTQAIGLGLLWLGLLAFAGYRGQLLAHQREQQAALVRRQNQLDAELAAARRTQDAASADLAQAEQQLAALPASTSTGAAIKPQHRDEINGWLVRVRRLRKVFDDQPRLRVPEMQFLKEEDWLRVAKTYPVETDDDLRAAAAAIRSAGTAQFAKRLSNALRKYTELHKNERPANSQVLVSYFDGPVDPMMLERYAIIDRPTTFGTAVPWGVTNQTPIDPDYDARYEISGTGAMTIAGGLPAWDKDVLQRVLAAAAKYRRDKPGLGYKSVNDLMPYFDPPLERDLAERLKKAERSP
jgi:hypothetical protein